MGSPKRSIDVFNRPFDETHPQFVNAVGRAFAILRCFEHGERYLGNQDIARQTLLPKPTVSRLTFTLASLGYLEYSATLEKYALGTAVLGLSHAYMKNNDVVSVARPLMKELAEYTQSAVMLGAADGLRMILLEVCQGDHTFQLNLAPGMRVPHGSTALGRADLAARPPELFEQRLAELKDDCDPEQWPRIHAGIVRAREEYETYGFCFSMGEWNPDVFAVGVPMMSSDRGRVLAFNCSGRISVMTREKLVQDFGPKLVALRNTVFEKVEGRF
ncbi:IclR family transcriptional regulator [Marilutibacter aestuarii]|uniref:IclR family transcriptional regulator n=1 Tax=Marilutibacter aestuarii TaxID=1706195 RepID=A0A507ZXK6_9GAMM|nr:IclR family transcriptional regulator [Lysobacter aestuarii]TQD41213.1 IclR family transcriptional regulator [Lysobacter aestuarii]